MGWRRLCGEERPLEPPRRAGVSPPTPSRQSVGWVFNPPRYDNVREWWIINPPYQNNTPGPASPGCACLLPKQSPGSHGWGNFTCARNQGLRPPRQGRPAPMGRRSCDVVFGRKLSQALRDKLPHESYPLPPRGSALARLMDELLERVSEPDSRCPRRLTPNKLSPQIILPSLIHLDAHNIPNTQPVRPLIDKQVAVDLGRICPCAAGGNPIFVDVVHDDL